MPKEPDREIGERAVQRGLISRSQLDEAMAELTARLEQSENPTSDTLTLVNVLIAKGFVKSEAVAELVGARPTESGMPTRAAELPQDVQAAMQFPDSRFSKYTIVRLLGTGGMGAVYQAWDNELRRYIALKFLTVGTEDNIKRFVREAQTAARLNHPNIAQVYDAGSVENRYFIAMEYIDGVTLDQLPDDLRRTELEKLVRIMREVSLAVDYAHSKGVVHRDLKPANIMIDEYLKPRIMDFGLARPVSTEELRKESAASGERITISGTIVGTPNFIAPEQARGDTERLDPRTDVYALGSTLYALVAGTPPFNAATPLETLMDVLQRAPASPTVFNEAVGRDLEAVILRCLEKEPVFRYQSAREVADDLQRILVGEAIQSRSAALAARLRRFIRTRPTTATILVSAALLCSIVLYFVSLRLRENAEQMVREQDLRARQSEIEHRAGRRANALKIVGDARPLVDRAERMLLLPDFSQAELVRTAQQAVDLLHRALQADDMCVEAYVLRGQAYALSGSPSHATTDFTSALQIDPESRAARMRRAVARLHQGLRSRRAARMMDMLGSARSWWAVLPAPATRNALLEAVDDFLQLRRGEADPFLDGCRLLAAGDLEGAARLLARAAETDRQNADAHFFLGAAHAAAGRHAEAEAALGNALTYRLHFGHARLWRAVVRLRMGRRAEAVEDAQIALGMEPSDPDLLILTGRIDALLQLNAGDPCALACRAFTVLADNPSQARSDLTIASRLRPEGLEVILTLLARAELAMRRPEAAEPHARAAVQLNAAYGPGHAALAAAAWARAWREAARESLDRALALDPDDADARELDGHMRFAETRFRDAIDAWMKASSLAPARAARLKTWIDRARERLKE